MFINRRVITILAAFEIMVIIMLCSYFNSKGYLAGQVSGYEKSYKEQATRCYDVSAGIISEIYTELIDEECFIGNITDNDDVED